MTRPAGGKPIAERDDSARLDWMEVKGWVPDYADVQEHDPNRTLRAQIDRAMAADPYSAEAIRRAPR